MVIFHSYVSLPEDNTLPKNDANYNASKRAGSKLSQSEFAWFEFWHMAGLRKYCQICFQNIQHLRES